MRSTKFSLKLLTFFSAVAIGPALTAEAQTVGSIAGSVASGRGDGPVAGALVEVRENGLKTTTTGDGTYSFDNIPPGTYTLEVTVSDEEHEAAERKVDVAAGKTSRQDVTLNAGRSALDEIVVLAQRTPTSVARKAQEEAPNLINIQTYQEIRKLPDISVAEAVRRIPGVSLETDEGEGRYINCRGLDADLNSTTFGGLRLPPTNNASPFGGYRAVTLDSIPIALIGAITVTKSNLPEQDAEDLACQIEITPKTVPQGRDFFIQGNLGSGYEPLRGTPITDVWTTVGGRFGPFSLLVGGSYYADGRGIDDVEPNPYFDAGLGSIQNIQQRDYELNRWRHSLTFDLGFQPDDDNSWYVRGFDAGYTERYKRQFLNLVMDGNTTVLPDGTIQDTLGGGTSKPVVPGAGIQSALRDERETSTDRVFVAGGRNAFNEGIVLDYRVGYTQGWYHKPYDYNSGFTYAPPAGSTGTPTITYSPSGPGHVPVYTISGAPGYLDPANYTLSSLSNSSQDNFDKELSFTTNLEVPLRVIGGDNESIKFGLSSRLRRKREVAANMSYPTLPSLLLSQVARGGQETYYGGVYQNGVDITPGYLQGLLGPGMVQPADYILARQQYLNVRENVYAAYAEYQLKLGRFGVVGGVRVEQTRDHSQAYETGVDASGNPTTPILISPSNHYTNVFPSVQGRFEIEPDLILRATYSSTLARPGFNQINPALNVDLGSGLVTTGNPNLKPATADNFDLTLEKYLEDAGVLSVGFFDKEFSNYIVPSVTSKTFPNNGLFPGNNVPFRVITFSNTPSSYARGIEFNWDQRFVDLPGFWSGFGVILNYTYVDSSFEIRPGETSSLPSSSQHTWNAAISYEMNGWSAKLAAYSVSADLFAIGADKTGDQFNGARTFLDFGSSYAVTDNWTVYFNAKNLLDTPHVFYQYTTSRPIQREFYSQTYQIGLRFDY